MGEKRSVSRYRLIISGVAGLFLAALTASCSSTKETSMVNQRGIVEWTLGAVTGSSLKGQTKAGDPQTIDSPYGKAVQFDGKGDAIFLDTNPLVNLRQFTVEVTMRPDPNGLAEQRFLQMGDVNGERMMVETRLTADNHWYLDAYIKSVDTSLTLIDKDRMHPVGPWYHVAVVVDNGKMDTFVDGKHELAGNVKFSPFKTGSTSIGVRMNKVYWYKGAIYRIRITPTCLTPEEFTR